MYVETEERVNIEILSNNFTLTIQFPVWINVQFLNFQVKVQLKVFTIYTITRVVIMTPDGQRGGDG